MMLVPDVSSIDSLVRRNRDKFSVRISTDDDFRGVEGCTPFGGDTLSGWKAVTFIDHVDDTAKVYVFGVVDGHMTITRPVTAISPSRCSVTAEDGRVYFLTDPVFGEPPVLIYNVAFALRAWGYDARYGLGVPMPFA